ncbi:MAG: SDR family oxidoreductase [Dehalococcoidia bacterium]|nr:MAG: SDR family oxidoreductase [Dehalococcoidia bacterium]
MGEALKGKAAVVTGSGRGIGRAIALALAAEGAKVIVNDPGVALDGTEADKAVADEVVEEIRRMGGEAVANYDSVSSMEGGERIIKTAVDNFGRLDILVNCAGILRDRMIWNMTEEEWDAVINTHLKGHFACTKAACLVMRQQRSGRIINITSTSGLHGNAGQANYSCAKAGVTGFTKSCALALGRYGITVNAVCPAAATRMTATIPSDRLRQLMAQRGAQFPEDTPMEELYKMMLGDPEDVPPIIVYLASDEAANINGQIFGASGGRISLYAPWTEAKTITKEGRWSIEELRETVPKTLAEGLVNPVPPQPPKE